MKVIIILGSRNLNGQTASAVQAVRKGVEAGGGRAETVFLPPLRIERCHQCDDSGWGLCIKECRCVINDDFAAVVDKIRAADAAVFATPVYYSDLSESMRAFLDRLRRICFQPGGRKGIEGKPVLGVCVAGGGGGGAPACCVSLEHVLATCRFDVTDMISVRRQNLDAKLQVLEQAGVELAKARTPQ
jgi:multimeric flavodoxin WrbA